MAVKIGDRQLNGLHYRQRCKVTKMKYVKVKRQEKRRHRKEARQAVRSQFNQNSFSLSLSLTYNLFLSVSIILPSRYLSTPPPSLYPSQVCFSYIFSSICITNLKITYNFIANANSSYPTAQRHKQKNIIFWHGSILASTLLYSRSDKIGFFELFYPIHKSALIVQQSKTHSKDHNERHSE